MPGRMPGREKTRQTRKNFHVLSAQEFEFRSREIPLGEATRSMTHGAARPFHFRLLDDERGVLKKMVVPGVIADMGVNDVLHISGLDTVIRECLDGRPSNPWHSVLPVDQLARSGVRVCDDLTVHHGQCRAEPRVDQGETLGMVDEIPIERCCGTQRAGDAAEIEASNVHNKSLHRPLHVLDFEEFRDAVLAPLSTNAAMFPAG